MIRRQEPEVRSQKSVVRIKKNLNHRNKKISKKVLAKKDTM